MFAPGRRFEWILIGALGTLIPLLGFIFRAPLLTGLANAWVVHEPVAHADAVVILGGGLENRPSAAARLFRDGIAPLVVYMDVCRTPAERSGVGFPESEQTRRILLSNGVPDLAMTRIGVAVGSTFDEAGAVLDWTKTTRAKSILIATDTFHTRRVRWLFERELRGRDITIYVQAVNPPRYNQTNWWKNEEGITHFRNEVIKAVYYWVKY